MVVGFGSQCDALCLSARDTGVAQINVVITNRPEDDRYAAVMCHLQQRLSGRDLAVEAGPQYSLDR